LKYLKEQSETTAANRHFKVRSDRFPAGAFALQDLNHENVKRADGTE